MMLDNNFYKMRVIGLLLVTTLLGACASNVVVNGNIPPPLIQRLPLSAAVTYSDEFKNFTYTEQEAARGTNLKSLNFSDAQVTMFDQVFAQLFTMVDGSSANTDLRITPEVIDFQYSAPIETQLSLYEVWLKYRIRVVDSQDQELADWIVKGYGKTPAGGTFSAPAKAFSAATNIALRDVGAQLSIGFKKQPSIQTMLNRRNQPTDTSTAISIPNLESVEEIEELNQPTTEGAE